MPDCAAVRCVLPRWPPGAPGSRRRADRRPAPPRSSLPPVHAPGWESVCPPATACPGIPQSRANQKPLRHLPSQDTAPCPKGWTAPRCCLLPRRCLSQIGSRAFFPPSQCEPCARKGWWWIRLISCRVTLVGSLRPILATGPPACYHTEANLQQNRRTPTIRG